MIYAILVSGSSNESRERETYTCTIRSITQQTQHEEEQRQAFARLLPLVLNDLRNARPKISHRARVSQDHRTDWVVRGILGIVRRLRNPDTSFPRDSPSRSTDDTDAYDAQRVLDPLARTIADIGYRGEGARAAPATRLGIAPVTSRQANVTAIATAK